MSDTGRPCLVASIIRAVSLWKTRVEGSDVPEMKAEEDMAEDEEVILEILEERHSLPGGALYQLDCGRVRFPRAKRRAVMTRALR